MIFKGFYTSAHLFSNPFRRSYKHYSVHLPPSAIWKTTKKYTSSLPSQARISICGLPVPKPLKAKGLNYTVESDIISDNPDNLDDDLKKAISTA